MTLLHAPRNPGSFPRRTVLRWGLGLAMAPAAAARASTAGAPPILRVSGDVADAPVTFSDAELMALPQISWKTSTIWTREVTEFSGPSLESLLHHVGAGDGDAELRALNDYSVTMPRELVKSGAPMLANRINGAPFPVRRRGPLWVVFPYDADVRFQTEMIYALSIWQLSEITVL